MHTLMAATDLSSRSDKALHQAALIALQCKARLVILHVVNEAQPAELVDRKTSEAKAILNACAADIAKLNDLEVDVVVRHGTPYLLIAETARERAADLIVMGAHQKDVWRDLFRDTTIERVV
jgi:universal stress protein E